MKKIGILMFILFIVHLIFNRKYLKNINKFKNIKGHFQNSLIFLMFICFVGSMLSGIIESRFLFANLGIKSSYFINRVHMLSAYWGFIFVFMYFDCHFKMIKFMFRKKKMPFNVLLLKLVNILILSYGVYTFFKMHYLDYLILNNYFFILNDDDNLFIYIFNNMSIMYSITYAAMFIKDDLLSLRFKATK